MTRDRLEPKHPRAPQATRAHLELTRREALQALGVALAAVPIGGCVRAPGEAILPYVHPPEDGPDDGADYATSLVDDGFAVGVLARCHRGRPTKLEGNPDHPASLGATTPQHQAAILELYDPHRARTVTRDGIATAWTHALAALASPPPGPLWLVMPPSSSPVAAEFLASLRAQRPDARVVWHQAVDHRAAYLGAVMAFGRPLEVQLDLRRADVVLALDADFLSGMPMSLRWARDHAARRRIAEPGQDPGRLYVVEPMPTPTGTLADHRLARPAGDVTAVALLLLAELGALGRPTPPLPALALAAARARLDDDMILRWIRVVAADLARHAGAGVVVVGDRQPAVCHAIGHWLNAALDHLGRTVTLTEPAITEPLGGATLAELADAARTGDAQAVVILGANPVLAAPPALGLADALARVPFSVHATTHVDETSAACHLVLPASHALEAWGEARAWDGTITFAQPTIRPIYATRSALELLAVLAAAPRTGGRDLLRHTATPSVLDPALARGLVDGSAHPTITIVPTGALDPAVLSAALAPRATDAADVLELALDRSPTVHDGRWAGNPWLQELPHPLTKLTWGNAAMLGPTTAARLGVDDGRVLTLAIDGREASAPAVIVAGHAEGCVTLEVGHGRRTPAQPIADGLGTDAYALRPASGAWLLPGVRVTVTARREALARTQGAFEAHGREVALTTDLDAWRREPGFTAPHRGLLPTLLGDRPPPAGPQWAMSIDTSICTGCSSCMVACQAENNVPGVGAEGVAGGREMHWIRIDTYRIEGGTDYVHQPMLCQHCEHAPCEYVCPVYATTHSPDGLNEMVYNRCVGTRFCSNNCPYKVRRFNWFHYTQARDVSVLARNPQVTVRARGVMEKCTYCVQRIRGTEITARLEGRALRPGEVVTACQQACPTGAIQFGSLEHQDTPMVRWRGETRAYAALHELGARPRTIYLARLRNPNPELEGIP